MVQFDWSVYRPPKRPAAVTCRGVSHISGLFRRLGHGYGNGDHLASPCREVRANGNDAATFQDRTSERGRVMAKVIIQRAWEHGADALTIEVRVDDSFPDVVAEAVHAAVNGYRESLDITVNSTEDDE